MTEEKQIGFGRLSGNQLKMIALVAMTCDHVGKALLPRWEILQILGRLAFPIFAYMIAEGCRYTKNRRAHLIKIAVLALGCQVVYFAAEGSLYQCILVTFSLAIGMIYAIDRGYQRRQILLPVVVAMGIWFVCVLLPVMLKGRTDFAVDYGIWGVLLPVLVYYVPQRYKLPAVGAALVPLCMELGGIQWWSFAALPLLGLYSGRRGRRNMKNVFFIYYPLHLAVIFLIGSLIH